MKKSYISLMIPKFKNNEKVVCVVDNTVLNKNDIYIIAGNSLDPIIRKIANEEYKDDNIYYFIIDDHFEYRDMFKENCFLSLKEYRKIKLNKIMRKKIPDDKKKVNANITIDKDLLIIMEEYLEENNISNKSKYIENLIREDFQKKGKNIEREF